MRFPDDLGDRPDTVFTLHALRTGRGEIHTEGGSAIVRSDGSPDEPEGWGDPAGICAILRRLEGWTSVLVERHHARRLAELLGGPVRYLDDVQYAFAGPLPDVDAPLGVRFVTPDDRPLTFADGVYDGHGPDDLLACAFDGGVVVGFGSSAARSARYADVGVGVAEPLRGRGLATAAATMVIGRIVADGLEPVWSTGETNLASRRVAEKLGFVEVSRRTYVIPAR